MNLALKQFGTKAFDLALKLKVMAMRPMIENGVENLRINHRYDTLHVATINYCNARCVFCGQHRFKRDNGPGVMSLELFNKTANQAYRMGMRKIDFTPPLGDPLLDDTLEEKARSAIEIGYEHLSITTNGILLTKDDRYLEIAKLFDFIMISMGGFSEEEYRKAYKVDKFNEVHNGLLCLLKCIDHQKQNSTVHLFIRSGEGIRSIKECLNYKRLLDYSKKGILNIEFTNFYDNWGGSVGPDDLFGIMKPRGMKKKLGVPCVGLLQFFVEHNGNVRLCGCRFKDKENDDLVVGNINDKDLRFILSPYSIGKIFDRFKPNATLPNVCVDCSLYRPMTNLA